jgi:ketosteroid isomerase-like protein
MIRSMYARTVPGAAAVILCLATTIVAAQRTTPPTPQAAVDQLLAADRAFSAESAKTTVVPGLTPMFAPGVIMPVPGGRFARGVAEVVDALKANADNVAGRVDWTPIRGGISADGLQGFTFGFMTLHKADGTTAPLKYMTYWVKGADGWRAAAYKRARRPDGEVSMSMMPPSLPSSLVAPVAVTDAVRQSLVAAEQAFSDEAQTIGLGPAFAKFGLPDAVNFGGAANYVVGVDAIAKLVGAGQPAAGSPVSWSCETPIVASSGDLGVSIGFIRQNAKAADGSTPPPSAFFTIWRKVNGTWKYIAE